MPSATPEDTSWPRSLTRRTLNSEGCGENEVTAPTRGQAGTAVGPHGQWVVRFCVERGDGFRSAAPIRRIQPTNEGRSPAPSARGGLPDRSKMSKAELEQALGEREAGAS